MYNQFCNSSECVRQINNVIGSVIRIRAALEFCSGHWLMAACTTLFDILNKLATDRVLQVTERRGLTDRWQDCFVDEF